jgi:Ca2+-transporting ATPase
MTMFFGVLLAGWIGLGAPAGGAVALPLLATQLLWINLATDGAPALALGLEPADPGLMERPPRPRGEGVITRQMWAGVLIVGAVSAVSALLVLDASLPGGLIEGEGSLRRGQTMTFTTLVFCSMFTVFTSRSEERSAFSRLFSNPWLWGSIALSLALQVAVVHVPFLQLAFSTTDLSLIDWGRCAVAASSVLWVRELSKLVMRRARARSGTGDAHLVRRGPHE